FGDKRTKHLQGSARSQQHQRKPKTGPHHLPQLLLQHRWLETTREAALRLLGAKDRQDNLSVGSAERERTGAAAKNATAHAGSKSRVNGGWTPPRMTSNAASCPR
ncbi:unnamed protein product, partial [Pylaiella littoralis]